VEKTTAPDIIVRRYWELVLRRRYLAISVALVVVSVFTWGSFFMPAVYEARSTVLIDKTSIMQPLIQGIGVAGGSEDSLSSLKESITSRNVILRALEKLGMVSDQSPARSEGLINEIRSNLAIELQGGGTNGTDLFTLSYRGRDPRTVSNVVNALVRECIDETIGFRRSDAYSAYEFIQSQLLDYKGKLEESDKAIREFRERNPEMIPQNETTLVGRIENFQASMIDSEIKLKELIRKKENLQKQLSGEQELTVAIVTNDDSPQGRLAHLNNQLVMLMTKYTDNYPEVIKVKSEIAELKKEMERAKTSHQRGPGSETAMINPIYQQLRQELTKTDVEVESLKARLAELSRQQREGERALGRMPKGQEEWTKLQRDRNVYQRIYDELLQKLESAKVSRDLEIGNKGENFKILDTAVPPRQPVKPNRPVMILMGMLFGILSGVASVIVLDYLNHSFKDEDSIESALGLSVLAAVPAIVTEEDKDSTRRKDKKVVTAAGLYLLVIVIVLAEEALARYVGIRLVNF
jgi:succinoglycan biosynthesis transport protein ExoP